MVELKAAHYQARGRHIAAKGLITRAGEDGRAAKITAATERGRQAYAQFDRINREAVEEMLTISVPAGRARELNDQIGRTWAGDAAVPDKVTRPGTG